MTPELPWKAMVEKKRATKKQAKAPTKRTNAAKPSLTARQLAFAEAYARIGVADRAAQEAGYSKATSYAQGSRLLKHAEVKAHIDGIMAKSAKKAGIDAEKVLDEFALIGFADLTEFVSWGPGGVVMKDSEGLDKARRRAIVEVSQTQHGIRIKLADKVAALDRLGKHLGMFVEKVEHSFDFASVLKARREKVRKARAGRS